LDACASGSCCGSADGAAADEDWTAEDELPAALTAIVDTHIAASRAELTKGMQLEAAKWLLGKQLLPPSEKKPELKAALGAFLSMKKEELAAGKVRVKTQALTIGAGQRAGLQGSAGYAGAVKGESNAVMSVRESSCCAQLGQPVCCCCSAQVRLI
jgi:hypothetical protein